MAVSECRRAVPPGPQQRAVRAVNPIRRTAPASAYDVAVTALMGLDAKLRLARTLVVVDTRHDDVAAYVSALYAQGADIIQVRDDEAPLDWLRTVVETAQRIAAPLNKLVAVTGDVDVARQVMADVLVGGPDLDPGFAHARPHEYALVGLPASTADDCRRIAGSEATEFAVVGPLQLVAGSAATAPGLDLVRVAAELMPVADPDGTPWFATGGFAADRIEEVVAAGARRAGLVMTDRTDIADVGRVSTALRRVWAADPSLDGFAFRALSRPSRVAGSRKLSGPTSW